MKKYIVKTLGINSGLIQGMNANPSDWVTTPVKVGDLETAQTNLTTAGNAIDSAEAAAKIARHDGNELNKTVVELDEQVTNLAYGIYAKNPDKLAEYGIKPRKDPSKIPPPSSILAIEINDDSDGEGFDLKIVSRDELADSYEWQKGQSTTPTDLNTIPPMIYFKTTSKTQFIDDDVVKGIRYFYRVRAMNRNGQGHWSEAASRVQ